MSTMYMNCKDADRVFTTYETTSIISARALQISQGCAPMVEPNGSPIDIASAEMKLGLLKGLFRIKRQFSTDRSEYVVL